MAECLSQAVSVHYTTKFAPCSPSAGHNHSVGIERGLPILYGGSVNPENADDFFLLPDVDGALVGGASLDPRKFFSILEESENNED